jgi:photosystem II stability/assembly factor-like uncharacterized protein
MRKITYLVVFTLLVFFNNLLAQNGSTPNSNAPQTILARAPFNFTKLPAENYPGKQDDIFAISESLVWYGNGQGKLYRSTNSGQTWQLMLHKPGTFWRCLAFTDSLHGFAGNVGTDYFPNVTDTIPLYRTTDGGISWNPAQIIGGMPKGLCAIHVQRKPFINHGILDYKNIIWGAGRVGSPAWVVKSTDNGKTFHAENLSHVTSAIFDIYFSSPDTGFICGASHADIDKAYPQVLRTTNAGKTWHEVYKGKFPYEITWKCSFPTKNTGYVSIQNYNPDTSVKARYVIKTTNAGNTWQEYPVAQNHPLRQFGIGFASEKTGWLGTTVGGYETTDGGNTWHRVTLGRAVNKFRIATNSKGKKYGYAIGADVYKLTED